MLSEIKSNKSLAFYELCNPAVYSQQESISMQNLSMAAFPMAQTAVKAGTVTVTFYNECNNYINTLAAERIQLNDKVAKALKANPHYRGSRNDGVKLAWKYEKADVAMGGKGSANWNNSERQEIMETGKVHQKEVDGKKDGPEGHHQKNVADHPEEQANPDNIKFYKNKEEHLNKGHDGDFKNTTDDEMIDKEKMLRRTNTKRVVRNELRAAGLSAVIGFGIGFTLSFVAELAKTGLSSEKISDALFHSGQTGLEMGALSLGTYSVGRGASYVIQKVGVDLMTKTGALIHLTTVGILSIVVISAYQCAKLQIQGNLSEETFSAIEQQGAYSLALLTVSIIAQGVWGGPAGLIVSTSFGLLFLAKDVADSVHKRKMEEKIRVYAIEQYKLTIKYERRKQVCGLMR